MGLFDYEYIKAYHEKSRFPLGFCISICSGETGGHAGNGGKRFKAGNFKLGDQRQADVVYKYTQKLKKIGFDDYSHIRFIRAFAKCFRVQQFNPEVFIKRAGTNFGLMSRQSSVENWLQSIEKVYNHGSKYKIPLAFLATEEVKKRSIGYKRK